jgi:hypothetical protein
MQIIPPLLFCSFLWEKVENKQLTNYLVKEEVEVKY